MGKLQVHVRNKLVAGARYADMPLEKIVQTTVNAKDGSDDKKK